MLQKPSPLILPARIIFAALLVYVTANSLVAAPDVPDGGIALTRWVAAVFLGSADHADKVSHFLAYGALGFFATASRFVADRLWWRVAGALAVYGLLIEGIQMLGGIRDGSWLDAMANMLGAISGVCAMIVLAIMIDKMLALRSPS